MACAAEPTVDARRAAMLREYGMPAEPSAYVFAPGYGDPGDRPARCVLHLDRHDRRTFKIDVCLPGPVAHEHPRGAFEVTSVTHDDALDRFDMALRRDGGVRVDDLMVVSLFATGATFIYLDGSVRKFKRRTVEGIYLDGREARGSVRGVCFW